MEDMIELSKLDENSGELPLEIVDMGEMSREVLKNLEPQAVKKSLLLFLPEKIRERSVGITGCFMRSFII
ncbi:MAG: hypothetical protein V8S22_07380 [Lachnospiraceae bacterium]